MPNRFVLVVACLIALPSLAQEVAQKPSWLPKTFPDTFDLGELSIAKISADKKSVQFARPKFEYVMATREVQKTVLTQESRVRSVTFNGKTEEVPYTVQVPVTVVEQQTYNMRRPLGSERFDVGIDKIKAWDLAGKQSMGPS